MSAEEQAMSEPWDGTERRYLARRIHKRASVRLMPLTYAVRPAADEQRQIVVTQSGEELAGFVDRRGPEHLDPIDVWGALW